MKNAIYLVVLITLFTACRQNISKETATELSTETTPAVTDTAIPIGQQQTQIAEQPKETPKLDLPFIGKRWYSMDNPMVYGNGYSVSDYVEIKSDGSVYFGNIIETKGNKKHTFNYYAGKFKEIIPCNYKGSEDFPPCYGFYKITADTIYSVDAKGTILSDGMCCMDGFPDEKRKCKCQSKLSVTK